MGAAGFLLLAALSGLLICCIFRGLEALRCQWPTKMRTSNQIAHPEPASRTARFIDRANVAPCWGEFAEAALLRRTYAVK